MSEIDLVLAIGQINPQAEYVLSSSVPPHTIIEWRGPGEQPTQEKLENAYQVYRQSAGSKELVRLQTQIEAMQNPQEVRLNGNGEGELWHWLRTLWYDVNVFNETSITIVKEKNNVLFSGGTAFHTITAHLLLLVPENIEYLLSEPLS